MHKRWQAARWQSKGTRNHSNLCQSRQCRHQKCMALSEKTSTCMQLLYLLSTSRITNSYEWIFMKFCHVPVGTVHPVVNSRHHVLLSTGKWYVYADQWNNNNNNTDASKAHKVSSNIESKAQIHVTMNIVSGCNYQNNTMRESYNSVDFSVSITNKCSVIILSHIRYIML